MKNKFEQQVRDALAGSEENFFQEPLPGHEERFEMRLLTRQRDKAYHLPRWPFIALAAASVAVAIISIVISEVKKTNSLAEKARLSDVSAEMAAMEDYYSGRLQLSFSGLDTQDENVKRFMQDIERLEGEYERLEKTLAKNFSNERIAEAMVNNYKYRLRLMEQLQKYIEIQNQTNTQDHGQEMSL